MKPVLRFLPAISLLATSVFCATRNPGTAVTVTRSRETVRECAFLGSLGSRGADERDESAASLQTQTAERGGNVLLLLGAGVGEAYLCEQRLIVSQDNRPRPTRYRLLPAPTPTPPRR